VRGNSGRRYQENAVNPDRPMGTREGDSMNTKNFLIFLGKLLVSTLILFGLIVFTGLVARIAFEAFMFGWRF
jgi:hypothetical protein